MQCYLVSPLLVSAPLSLAVSVRSTRLSLCLGLSRLPRAVAILPAQTLPVCYPVNTHPMTPTRIILSAPISILNQASPGDLEGSCISSTLCQPYTRINTFKLYNMDFGAGYTCIVHQNPRENLPRGTGIKGTDLLIDLKGSQNYFH